MGIEIGTKREMDIPVLVQSLSDHDCEINRTLLERIGNSTVVIPAQAGI